MPPDTAETIASALSERTSRTPKTSRKPARAKKKVLKARTPRRESTKTITTRLYRKWAEIVHRRAGDRCEVCGVGGKLDAHHIQPRQICSGLRFDPENGICLCSSHHRFGHESAHKGMLWFCEWLRHNRSFSYNYVYANRDKELDCGDRMVLYGIESWLHGTYSGEPLHAVDPLPTYSVRFVLKGEDMEASFVADNPKAAEFMCQNDYGRGVKVIRTELVK